MTTRPLQFKGQQLLLNYVVNPGGTLTVEAFDKTGNVIGKSKPLSGDAVDAPISWSQKPDLSTGNIQLRFNVKNADVYSLRFK